MQPYLTSPNLTLSDKKFLFKLRSKMLRIKGNFSSIYKNDLSCSLCLDQQTEENEIHLLCCPIVKQDKEIQSEIQSVNYEDAFENIIQQKKAVKVFRRIMELIDKQKKWQVWNWIEGKIKITRCIFTSQMPHIVVYLLYDMDFNIYIYLLFVLWNYFVVFNKLQADSK